MTLKKLQNKPSPGSKAAGEPPRAATPAAPEPLGAALAHQGSQQGMNRRGRLLSKPSPPLTTEQAGAHEAARAAYASGPRFLQGRRPRPPPSFAWETAVHNPAPKEPGGLHL